MNMLIDSPPLSVVIGGKEVPINWGFRTSVAFQMIIQDSDLNDTEKVKRGLELYYPTREDDIDDIPAAVDRMLWFFGCGKTDDDTQEHSGKGSEVRAYSYKYDDALIYAAFYDQYGIDLTESEMHWWKFRALSESFRDDLMISQVMKYRTADTAGMDKEQAAFYRRMKKLFRLPEEMSNDDKKQIDEINRVLAEGGSLTGLLGE